jgi:hypothetical protein
MIYSRKQGETSNFDLHAVTDCYCENSNIAGIDFPDVNI